MLVNCLFGAESVSARAVANTKSKAIFLDVFH